MLGPNTTLRWEGPPKVRPSSAEPYATEQAIKDWATHQKEQPKPKSLANKRRKMKALFAFVGKPDDLTQITSQELQRYKEHLLRQAEADPKIDDANNYCRGYLTDVKALLTTAWKNHKFNGRDDPGKSVVLPPKREGETRDGYTDDQARKIIDALDRAPPEIEWPTRLAAALGTITSEIVDATTFDVERTPSGMVVLTIQTKHRKVVGSTATGVKTAYRPRRLPLPDYLAERFWGYVEGVRREYGPGPLFPMVPVDHRYGVRSEKAGALLREFIKKLGVGGTPYCWRHRVTNQLKAMKDLDPDTRRHMVGHKPLDVHATHYLHYNPAELKPYVERINPTGPVKPVEPLALKVAAE
jgi:integrase